MSVMPPAPDAASVFHAVVDHRRSIRRYTSTPVPREVMMQAFADAVLAPNSSNAQTWDFYWVKKEPTRQKLVEACLNQSAARTAQELVVVVGSPRRWQRSQPRLATWVADISAPKQVVLYYQRLLPAMYRWGLFNTLGIAKHIAFWCTGLVRPIMRGPTTKASVQEVCVKSAALAAENFVLSIAAHGFSTCMMEGMDEHRIRRMLGLPRSDRVVMVISVGEAAERGTWGPRYRIPLEEVVHEV
jgi:nitroreductase